MTPEELLALTPEEREMLGVQLASNAIGRYFQIAGDDETIEKLVVQALNSIDYKTANEYAVRVGELMGEALREEIAEYGLNLIPPQTAQSLLTESLSAMHTAVDSMTKRIQMNMNAAAGLGLSPVSTVLDTNRIEGLAKVLASSGTNEAMQQTLGEPIVNFSQAIVDRSIRDNAAANTKAGLKSFIVRETGAEEIRQGQLVVRRGNRVYRYVRNYKVPCKWCANLAGVYNYDEVKNTGNNVFRRHEGCRCLVTYRQGVRVVDVWSKQEWTQANVIQQANKVQAATQAAQAPTINMPDNMKQLGEPVYKQMHDIAENAPENSRIVWNKYESRIRIDDLHTTGTPFHRAGGINVRINEEINPIDGYSLPWQTWYHECHHCIDYLAGRAEFGIQYSIGYKNGLFAQTIKKEVQQLVTIRANIIKPLVAAGDLDELVRIGALSVGDRRAIERGWYELKYKKEMAYRMLQQEVRQIPSIARADLSDILEGATNRKVMCGFGHPTGYWNENSLAKEAFAEMSDSLFTNPESYKVLQQYLPESLQVYHDMIEEIAY